MSNHENIPKRIINNTEEFKEMVKTKTEGGNFRVVDTSEKINNEKKEKMKKEQKELKEKTIKEEIESMGYKFDQEGKVVINKNTKRPKVNPFQMGVIGEKDYYKHPEYQKFTKRIEDSLPNNDQGRFDDELTHDEYGEVLENNKTIAIDNFSQEDYEKFFNDLQNSQENGLDEELEKNIRIETTNNLKKIDGSGQKLKELIKKIEGRFSRKRIIKENKDELALLKSDPRSLMKMRLFFDGMIKKEQMPEEVLKCLDRNSKKVNSYKESVKNFRYQGNFEEEEFKKKKQLSSVWVLEGLKVQFIYQGSEDSIKPGKYFFVPDLKSAVFSKKQDNLLLVFLKSIKSFNEKKQKSISKDKKIFIKKEVAA